MVQGHSRERGDCGLSDMPQCGKSLTLFSATRYNLCLFGRGVEQSGSSSGS